MLLDILEAAFKAIIYTAAGLALLIGLAFVVAHVHDTWNAPAYPYTGFSPECPSWDADL